MNLVTLEITIVMRQLVRDLRRAKTDGDRRIYSDRIHALTSEYERALNSEKSRLSRTAAPDA
jgi:RNA polymerase-interacting CarD/CdnL/TRCF family regulator